MPLATGKKLDLDLIITNQTNFPLVGISKFTLINQSIDSLAQSLQLAPL